MFSSALLKTILVHIAKRMEYVLLAFPLIKFARMRGKRKNKYETDTYRSSIYLDVIRLNYIVDISLRVCYIIIVPRE